MPRSEIAPHPSLRRIPQARVYSFADVLAPAECARVVELAAAIGATRATQSRDPGLNTVLRVPVNGTAGHVEERLELLRIAFDVHARACAAAEEAYGVAVARPPTWKALPRRPARERLLANVTEWNARVRFNMNVLGYTAAGGNAGVRDHRDESPLAFVVPLLSRRVAGGGGTRYAHLGAKPTTLRPTPGTLVLHPGDATHAGVPIRGEGAERWILAGFLDTRERRPAPRPEPPLTRAGDARALAARWGVAAPGCDASAPGGPAYTKTDGETAPLHLGRAKGVHARTRSRGSGRAYRYYVTGRCRAQGQLDAVRKRLRTP